MFISNSNVSTGLATYCDLCPTKDCGDIKWTIPLENIWGGENNTFKFDHPPTFTDNTFKVS